MVKGGDTLAEDSSRERDLAFEDFRWRVPPVAALDDAFPSAALSAPPSVPSSVGREPGLPVFDLPGFRRLDSFSTLAIEHLVVPFPS
jgi:hypothetical protein